MQIQAPRLKSNRFYSELMELLFVLNTVLGATGAGVVNTYRLQFFIKKFQRC